MTSRVLFFNQVNRSSLPYVGGKGANLGELSHAGFPVPDGFCISTAAYKDFIATSNKINEYLESLNKLDRHDSEQLRETGKRIRSHLHQLNIPGHLKDEIVAAWKSAGMDNSYAIRSSATAEDLPNASFAGQQDTYLNIRGEDELLKHIRKCWASLFTDRAIAYRTKNGFDHYHVYLSVVVQKMVSPEISGIMFTADPSSGNRRVVSIDASFGLGEAIVSGLVSADLYKVKEDKIIHKNISVKKKAVFALPEGGTISKDLPQDQQKQQTLSDEYIQMAAKIGKQIEKHFGAPQDIEFCVEMGKFYVVQSRPITTLYPLPDIPQESMRILYSFGHFQMMTDAVKPLGLSVLKTIMPIPAQYTWEAGGRLYVDVSEILRHRIGRRVFPAFFKNMDEAASRAIQEVMERPEFLKVTSKRVSLKSLCKTFCPLLYKIGQNLFKRDPALAIYNVEAFIKRMTTDTRKSLQNVSGARRLETVQTQLNGFFKAVFPNIFHYAASFVISSILLEKMFIRWLGNDKELRFINKSLPGNVTSEMGLKIGDLADTVRGFPEVKEYLKKVDDETFYEELKNVHGGKWFQKTFEKFITTYGSRCAGEIDITRPRWREAPTQLVPAILGHMRSVKPGVHRRKFIHGDKEAKEAEQRILYYLKGNRIKAKLVKRFIKVYRNYGGLREHHKYLLTLILDECKKAIIAEAKEYVQNGTLSQPEDVYFLTLDEFIQLTKGQLSEDVSQLIVERKATYEWHKTLKPPRVLTNEGESVIVPKTGHFPAGSLIGSPVSSGIIEGKARIVLKPEEAELHEGEILVAPHTDPGWTPLFQSAKGLITEVGGLMTHGSVVAREYGIPAVVGIDEATLKIQTGQLIRLDGDQGYVEILKD
ncbi:phosphoenolpyruvate synthase [Alteribacillus bidgolensis]|uniref:Phosphoenolpyruvate synthase n=1 Tax=Alteribacillus bidgolensis TaxID=930129 RepID=A0A1G8CS01_9BACI|nr:phosphoenolpyruvate synthase [Alteribacillus bidgolensis]SDH48212.1 phosphoenolpyruvate synthase [Alteribacillus bidgolensis]